MNSIPGTKKNTEEKYPWMSLEAFVHREIMDGMKAQLKNGISQFAIQGPIL